MTVRSYEISSSHFDMLILQNSVEYFIFKKINLVVGVYSPNNNLHVFWVREIGDAVGPSMETGGRLKRERVFIGVTSANID